MPLDALSLGIDAIAARSQGATDFSPALLGSVLMHCKPATFGGRGHKYVVIKGQVRDSGECCTQGTAASEMLAVYRVRNDGTLQRLRRYPVALRKFYSRSHDAGDSRLR